MPSYGNGTIGEVPNLFMGNKAVISPIAVNGMRPGQQAGMLNAHIGQNYNVVEPVPARAALLAADDTPGIDGNGAAMVWDVDTGTWGPPPP